MDGPGTRDTPRHLPPGHPVPPALRTPDLNTPATRHLLHLVLRLQCPATVSPYRLLIRLLLPGTQALCYLVTNTYTNTTNTNTNTLIFHPVALSFISLPAYCVIPFYSA